MYKNCCSNALKKPPFTHSTSAVLWLCSRNMENCRSVLQKYYTFCRQYDLTALPASTDSLNGFAVITALQVKSPHTVSNYISALKSIHHVLDLPPDSFSDFSLCLTLRGLHRSMICVSQWKHPITIQML